jgi:hypothetical protein
MPFKILILILILFILYFINFKNYNIVDAKILKVNCKQNLLTIKYINLNKEYTKQIKINSEHCLNYNTDSYLNIKVYKDSTIVIHDSKDYIYTAVLDLSFSILILLLFLI